MRKMMYSVAVLALAAGMTQAASVAHAKDTEYRRSVKVGEAAELIPHSSMRGECLTKVPAIKILEEPKNGTASIKEGERKFENGKGNFAKCDGKVGIGARVVYTPKSGFVGTDKLRYEVTFESGSVSTYAFMFRIGRQDSGGWTNPK